MAAAVPLVMSGGAGLVYQLLWIKQLSLVVGVDVYAVTVAVSAFFGGLAIGSAIFGARADALARPLRFYAMLEIGIALLGVGATAGLSHAAELFAVIEGRVGPLAWGIPFLAVGIPAVLMGGTVPVMIRACRPAGDRLARGGGELYAANTAGAIAGALATPFILVPAFGVTGSAFAAAGLNVLAAAAALSAGAWRVRAPVDAGGHPAVRVGSGDRSLALRLYAIGGGIAMGYEVIWSQAIVQFVSTRVFAFAIVLATYLAGLTLGSAAYARFARRVRDPWSAFALLVAAAGLVALVGIATLGPWLMRLQSDTEDALRAWTGNELAAMCGRFAIAAVGVVFGPTLLLGAAFPAVLRLAASERAPAWDVGAALALNTAGGIAGTLLTGFLLVPVLGIVRSLGLLAVGAAALGIVAASRGTRRGARLVVSGIALASVVLAALTPQDRLAHLLTVARSGGDMVFYAESPGGTVAVVQQRGGDSTFRRLYIDGVSNSGDALTSLRYMRLQALLPLLIHRGDPESALVVGFGTGITAGSLLAYPGLQRRVCAELLPAVVQAAPFFSGNFDAARDPRLQLRLRDGRRELLRSDEQYDLITLEPPPPSARGVVNLYSRDFYALAARRLRPNGMLAQWWPLPTQNDEDSRSLVRSLLDVFPHASLWTTELHEMLLIGSPDPMRLDAREIARRFSQPDVAAALSAVGIGSPVTLMATWVAGRDGLERYADTARPVTDDRPRIEYAAWTRPGEFRRVLPAVLALQSAPPLVNADQSLLDAVASERSRLHRFYEAGLRASAGDREEAVALLRQVLSEDDHNPYYRWMAGLPRM